MLLPCRQTEKPLNLLIVAVSQFRAFDLFLISTLQMEEFNLNTKSDPALNDHRHRTAI